MTASNFMPDVKTEVAFNAGWSTPAASRTWTDISTYAELHEGIDIQGGRGDEQATADANVLKLVLDNSDGRFTPAKASSPYYPNVKIGRPIRVRATHPPAASTNLLSANAASMETSIADWAAAGTPLPVLSQSSVRAYDGTKSLLITWQGGGGFPQAQATVSGLTIGLTYTFSAYVYIPAGSNNVVPIFATASGAQVSARDQWVRTSVSFTATATSHSIAIRGIAPTIGNTCWVDAAMVNLGDTPGEFNTLAQTTMTLYTGFVDEWPREWDGDKYAKSVLSATTRTARLSNERKLKSIIEEEYRLDSPSAVYTLSEPAGSTQVSDTAGVSQLAPLSQSGSGTAVVFGSAIGPGTDSLTAAQFTNGGKSLQSLTSQGALATGVSAVAIDCYFNTTAVSANGGLFVDAITAQLGIDGSGNLFFQGTLGGVGTSGTSYVDGNTHHVVGYYNGANMVLYVDGVLAATAAVTGTMTVYPINGIGVSGAAGLLVTGLRGGTITGVIAHAALYLAVPSPTRIAAHANAGLNGFRDELSGARFTRYASYAGIAAAELLADAGQVPMSHVDTTGSNALDMMHVVEATEEGVVFDAKTGESAFHDRFHRYSAVNAFTLDMSLQQVEADYVGKYDRTGLVNDVTAALADGTASAHLFDQASQNDYGIASTELSLAATNADEPFQAASWKINTYSQPRERTPSLAVDVLALPIAIQALVLAADVSTRLTVTNVPSQAASSTASYFVEGYQLQIGPESLRCVFNVSDATVADVWTVEDPVLGQYDAYPIAL